MSITSQDLPESPLLSDDECKWVELQPEFERLGYRFRPRFRQGWVPSWDVKAPFAGSRCEDYLSLRVRRAISSLRVLMNEQNAHIMDAVRLSDNARVIVKRLPTDERGQREAEITAFLSGLQSQRIFTVPLLDTIRLRCPDDTLFLVLPELVEWDHTSFKSHGEILDFVRQILYVSSSLSRGHK